MPCTPRDVLVLLLSPSAASGEGQHLAKRGNCHAGGKAEVLFFDHTSWLRALWAGIKRDNRQPSSL